MIGAVPLAKDILTKPSQILLLGAFGISLLLALRKGEGISQAFERYAVGFFVILFYVNGLQYLFQLGNELDQFLGSLGDKEALHQYVANSLFKAATAYTNPNAGALNLAMYLGQVIRTGAWGIIASVTEFIFLIARFLLQVSRDVLWQILFILLPLGAAVFPLFPKILIGMLVLALELCLWLPVLTIVNVSTSLLAREYGADLEEFGLKILACEVVAILLTLSIPAFIHKMISGSLTGDILGSWTKTLAVAGAFFTKGASLKGSVVDFVKKRVMVIALFFLPAIAFAEKPIPLSVGYVSKIICHGKLLVSAIGNDSIIELNALPRELGCGVLVRPKAEFGRTNIILETTSGTVNQVLEITKNKTTDLEIELKESAR